MGDEWAALAGGRYLNLESFRRDGTAVRTPLWFAPSADGAVFYVYSVADSFKIKRLRRNPRCRIAACTMRGAVTGPWLDATATILAIPEAATGMALLDRRYWPFKQMLGLLARLRPAPRAVVAIRRAPGA